MCSSKHQSSIAPSMSTRSDAAEFSSEFSKQTNLELHRPISTTSTFTATSTHSVELVSPSSSATLPLPRPLQVPTKSSRLSSGFPYPAILESYSVSPALWSAFTSDLLSSACLTPTQFRTVMLKSLGGLAVGSLLAGGFGLVTGYVVGKKAREHQEVRNWGHAEEDGRLRECVERWNREVFKQRGILVRIDLPGRGDDIGAMDVVGTPSYQSAAIPHPPPSLQQTKGSSLSSSSTTSTTVSQTDAGTSRKEKKLRTNAFSRGRVVIIPLDTVRESGAEESFEVITPAAESSANVESVMYEQRTGTKDWWPDEPKP